MEKVTIWYVENLDGDGSTKVKYFKTEEEAREYAAITLGSIWKLSVPRKEKV